MMSSKELPTGLKKTFSLSLQFYKIVGFNIFDDPNKSFIRKYANLIFNMLMFILLTVLTNAYFVVELSGSSFLKAADAIPFGATFMQGELILL